MQFQFGQILQCRDVLQTSVADVLAAEEIKLAQLSKPTQCGEILITDQIPRAAQHGGVGGERLNIRYAVSDSWERRQVTTSWIVLDFVPPVYAREHKHRIGPLRRRALSAPPSAESIQCIRRREFVGGRHHATNHYRIETGLGCET